MQELELSDIKSVESGAYSTFIDEIKLNIEDSENITTDNEVSWKNTHRVFWICGSIVYIIFPLIVISISSFYYYNTCSFHTEIYTIIHEPIAIIIWIYLLYKYFISKPKDCYDYIIFVLSTIRLEFIAGVYGSFIFSNNFMHCKQFYFIIITLPFDICSALIITIIMYKMTICV